MEAAYSEHSIAIPSISMAGYVTAVPAFTCGELPTREASSFCGGGGGGGGYDLAISLIFDFLLFNSNKPLFFSSAY